VKRQAKIINELHKEIGELQTIVDRVEAAFVPEFRVPTRAQNSVCICCGGKNGLSAVGIGRDIAIYRAHNVVVHRKEHKICSNCARLPVDEMRIESAEETLRRTATTSPLLASLRRKESRAISYYDLSDAEMKMLTGLTFANLMSLRETTNADPQQLFQFFVLCRQAWSQRALAVVTCKAQATISEQFHTVLDALTDNFTALHLRQSMRDIVRSHIPNFVKNLFPNVKGIIDGGYYFINKSVNFNSQKQSYSPHKYRNLVKVMGVMLPDGTWWDILGMSV
jgi:hypothetical protein